MKYITSNAQSLYGICRSCKFNHTMTTDFISYLEKLESSRGIHSVVDILKSRYHSLVAGGADFKVHSDGTWVGPFRSISRLSKRGRGGLKRSLRILRCHGLFIHRPPNKGDYQRQYDLLQNNPEPEQALLLPVVPWFYKYTRINPTTYSDSYPLSTKRAPYLGGKIAEVLYSPAEHVRSLDAFPSFMVEFHGKMSTLVGSSLPPIEHYKELLKLNKRDVAGSAVLLVKDRGLKLRLIANCNRMLQLAVSPMHNYLYALLKSHESSFVHDQDGGAAWVTEQLCAGTPLTSLDLKSASDNIPLRPQLALMQDLCPELETECEMFAVIARMSWTTPYPDVEIRWTRGHPMGVMGSFPLFTTWLASTLMYAGLTEKFAIVGDDIVFHAKYEEAVLRLLKFYQVPISSGKSLFGNEYIAEFVGRVIDKYSSLEVYKASPYSRQDPLGLIRQYGKIALDMFKTVRLSKRTKETLLLGHLFETDLDFKAACIELANPRDKMLLEGSRPTPLNRGGVSDTIIKKMIGNVLMTRVIDEDLAKAISYSLLGIWDTGRMYGQLILSATHVQRLVVRSNSTAHIEHNRMLLSLLKDAKTTGEVEEVKSFLSYAPGLVVENTDKSEQIALKNKIDPDDRETKYGLVKRKRSSFAFYYQLRRAIHRTATRVIALFVTPGKK